MTNPLIGASKAQQDTEDQLTAGLSSIAYPDKAFAPLRTEGSSRFGTRRSRFWFKLETLKEETTRRKKEVQSKQLDHIDAEVQARLTQFKSEFPPELRDNMERVREFLLKDIAPLTMAVSGGALQSRDVIQQLVGSPVDAAILSRLEQMASRAAVLKLGLFVQKYFGLPDEHLPTIFGGNLQPNGGAENKELTELVQMMRRMTKSQEEQGSQLRRMRNEQKAKRASS